jgi:hypothetical protein
MIHIGHRNSNLALCKKIRRYCFASQSYASILRSGRSSQYFGAHESPELPAKIESHIKSIETDELWFKHPGESNPSEP